MVEDENKRCRRGILSITCNVAREDGRHFDFCLKDTEGNRAEICVGEDALRALRDELSRIINPPPGTQIQFGGGPDGEISVEVGD